MFLSLFGANIEAMRAPALALIACLWSGAALAAPPPGLPPQPPKEVSGLTVYARTDPPKVTATYPAAGQALPAGVVILTLTFDQRMLDTGFDIGSAAGGEMPHCLKTPRLLEDGKTFVLLCTVEPRKTYALAFNAKPQGGFANVAEHRAEPSTLSFTTTDGDGPRSISEALKVQNLRTVDMPIQIDPDHEGRPVTEAAARP
ncbi:MAG: hypothetical protein JWR47_216 [Phenylobacterium sp.]|jgi:hypothetical protein|uniref:hypothetical protein n=1 Tax=Phenylobacterium sp. TaxID=1871053 RepID=UPI00260A6A38|nr:hypothetical protein [Phenylobacterium sp.]MDB5433959.1 hypothetical protein [Phenylobacterium sp.]MDB5462208.1 hypothetical protein [Phenylobacterium sp.]MDB5499695.1 hypothetical protein [Phenylobacterium sp.]